MKKIKIVLLVLLILDAHHLYAQLKGQALIDSMLKELPRQTEDTLKVKLLNNLGNAYTGIDPDEGIKYGRQALTLAIKLNDKKGMGSEYNLEGNYYLRKGDFAKALAYYFKCVKVYEEIGNEKGIGSMNSNIALVYQDLKEYDKALEYGFKALKSAQKSGNKKTFAATTANIGLVYKSQKNYPKALEYFLEALKVDEESGYKEYASVVCLNLGSIYEIQHEYTMALEYYAKSRQIGEDLENKSTIASCANAVGSVYLSIINDTLSNKGSLSVTPEQPMQGSKPTVYIPKGKAALLEGAIDHLRRGLAISRELKYLGKLQTCYSLLSEAYKLKGDFKKALEYSDSSRILIDSIFSNENQEKITRLENSRKEFGDSLKAVALQKATDAKTATRRNYELIGGAAFLSLLGLTFLLKKKNNLLDKEKKQNESLLHNILPEEVATQLKDSGKSAAKQFDNVTVLFTDFVNFTEASERMKPDMLIEELDTCFKAFDEITARYNIEKIKTIGDAYLAVCGLPSPDPQHALNILSAAKEINEFMENRLARLGTDRTFPIRIGIHSGSVVAGIVGVKKFAYDIWGDTVNTAARMEQHGEQGQINISQTTFDLVKEKVRCEYRGELQVKGKGAMKMYFVS